MEAPEACARCGRRYRPYKVLVNYERCNTCPPERRVGGGHTSWWCRYCGWLAVPEHEPPGWDKPLPADLRVRD